LLFELLPLELEFVLGFGLLWCAGLLFGAGCEDFFSEPFGEPEGAVEVDVDVDVEVDVVVDVVVEVGVLVVVVVVVVVVPDPHTSEADSTVKFAGTSDDSGTPTGTLKVSPPTVVTRQ
jgi:hypothetical protein